jgi:hypothetical protein
VKRFANKCTDIYNYNVKLLQYLNAGLSYRMYVQVPIRLSVWSFMNQNDER